MISKTSNTFLSIYSVGDREKSQRSLENHRDSWNSEMSALKPPGDRTIWGIEAIAMHIANNICDGIKGYCEKGSSRSELKKVIFERSRISGKSLVNGYLIGGRTFEALQESASNPREWKYLIVGLMRQRIFGLDTNQKIKRWLDLILDDCSLKKAISGPAGYARVSELFCNGNMAKAFTLLKDPCLASKSSVHQLSWGSSFPGSVKAFRALRKELRACSADLSKSILYSVDGYCHFAQTRCNGNMNKASLMMSAACKAEGIPFWKLRWGSSFNGTVDEFKTLGQELIESLPDLLNSKFYGIEGYLYFAETYCNGRMLTAFMIMSALCKANNIKFSTLNWGKGFRGTVQDYKSFWNDLRNRFPYRKESELRSLMSPVYKRRDGSLILLRTVT